MSYTSGTTRNANDEETMSLSNVELADADEYDVVNAEEEEEEYARDRADRSGLPVIPLGKPPAGDTIDVASIQREFNSRAARRPTASPPVGAGGAVPLKKISSGGGGGNDASPDDDEDEFAYDAPERRMAPRKLPKRTFFTAVFLLGVGVIFCTLGLSFLFTLGLSEALPFLILGGIAFIPGSYVSFIMYQTWKGVPGYSYDQIPSYDD
jgi:hypothetical protein